MNKYISEKMKRIKPYMANEQIYKIKLDANENNGPIPKFIRDEIATAISELPFNRYPDPMSSEVCKKFGEIVGVDIENIVAGSGLDDLLGVIINFFMDKDDSILTFYPDYPVYSFYATVPGVNCISVGKGDDMVLSADMVIENYKKYKPRIIIFSNPCNPTGLGLMREEVIKILDSVDCIVVVDEAYMDFWNQSVLDKIPEYDNLIVLRTCSKAFGMAGLRLGFAMAQKELIDEIKKAKAPYNVSYLTQAAAMVFFKHVGDIRKNLIDIIELRSFLYDSISEMCKKVPGMRVYESGANFLYVYCPNGDELDKQLKANSIIIRNFGGGYLRIAVGNQNEIDSLLEVMKKTLLPD